MVGSCSAERDKEDLLEMERHHLLGTELRRFVVDKAFHRSQGTALLAAGRALAVDHKRNQRFRSGRELENADMKTHYFQASA